MVVGRIEFEDKFRVMFEYYHTWAHNSKLEEQMVQELDEFYQMQRVQWSTEAGNVPYWVVRCIAVWSKFNIKKAKTLCMSYNHSSGYGCLKEKKAKCDYTHECLFCSSRDHGVYILKPNGKFVCPKVQKWDTETKEYRRLYGEPNDEELKALARTQRPPDSQHGPTPPGRPNSTRGNPYDELRSETDGESETPQDAVVDNVRSAWAEPMQPDRETHNKVPQPRRAASITRPEPRRTQALGGSLESELPTQDPTNSHIAAPHGLPDAAWPSLGATTGVVSADPPSPLPEQRWKKDSWVATEDPETSSRDGDMPRVPPPPPPPAPPQTGPTPSPIQIPPPGLQEPKLSLGTTVKLVEEEPPAPLPPALSQTSDVAQLPRGPPPKPPGRAKAPPPSLVDSFDIRSEPAALTRLEKAVPGSAEMLRKAKVLHLESGSQYAEKLLEWVVQNEAAELQELADSSDEIASFAGMKPLPAQRLKRALLSIVDRMAL